MIPDQPKTWRVLYFIGGVGVHDVNGTAEAIAPEYGELGIEFLTNSARRSNEENERQPSVVQIIESHE